MPTNYQIKQATISDRKGIVTLLQTEKLPVEDLPLTLDHFYIATDRMNAIIGAIGLESHGRHGLLRSMVVARNFRNHGIAAELVGLLQTEAKIIGMDSVYLLTETASDYFSRKGFNKISRDEVPEEIKLSSEFSNVCPVSAVVMFKKLSP
ncbi:MAG: arsenic resistance N-acetyltransferase ArsN2 [Chitinophagaceae bacterium]